MKRAWIATSIAALALALPAWGQIRGVPASVTSMAPWRRFTPGPPASVTSLGPLGYGYGYPTNCSAGGISPLVPSAGCFPTQFTGSFFPVPGNRGNWHGKRHHADSNWPVYVPYAYPVVYPVAVPGDAEAQADANVEPDPPAPTIFEHRATSQRPPLSASSSDSSHYGNHYLDSREQPVAAAPDTAETPEPTIAPVHEQIPVVLIYRDGHEQEVRNYAIVGQTLYDLGTFVTHKIPLADLDLAATIKANEDNGVEFSVPAPVKLN